MSSVKGNLIVLQSGGPTAVINSSVAGVVLKASASPGVGEVYGAINGILGVLNEELVDLKREDPGTIEGLRSTPSSALGSCRYKIDERDLERVFDVIRAHDIHYFLIAGGNDSMDTGDKVARMAQDSGYELRVIGVPKTVDNDLVETDHCPGYPSIARWLAIAVRDAGLDTEAIYTSDTVKVVETMGRDSGWVTAATALARENEDDAPHLVYLPERPFAEDRFLEDVDGVYRRLGYCVIAACEGLRDENGEILVESSAAVDEDAFGHAQRGGVGQYLCDLIAKNLKIKARADKPGTIQRVSMVGASRVDLEESFMVGQRAVEYALEGSSGHMVGIARGESPGTLVPDDGSGYSSAARLVDFARVANSTKGVPDSFINPDGNFVSDEFTAWARPLIGDLPKYARLQKFPVSKKLRI